MSRWAAAALALLVAGGCQHLTEVTLPAPKQDVVVLLPDPETQAIGRATVFSPLGGSAELSGDRAATRVGIGQPPAAPFTMDDAAVQKMFGDAMAARPLAPRQFLLYFVANSNQLTPESEALLPMIIEFVKNRPTPDVSVIGHTDSTGSAQSNIELGRSRAIAIRDHLVANGLDGRLVTVASHGKADLLVRTPDGTPEPRNRRVEVSVR